MKRILLNTGLLLASTMTAVGVGEGLIRVFAPQSVAVPWEDELDGIKAPRANVRGRHAIPDTFDVRVSFNSQRFRGQRNFQERPASGVLRIAVLGDSFTFGFGANDSETYPAHLERLLQQKISAKRERSHLEVINAGIAGSGTGEQALWYDTWVKNFYPDVVILTVVPNDVDDDLHRGLFVLAENGEASPRTRSDLKQADSLLRTIRTSANSFPGYSVLAQQSQLIGFLRNIISAAIARRRYGIFSDHTNDMKVEDPKELFKNRGLPLVAGEVTWLSDRVKEQNRNLVIVFVPSRESIYESSSPWAAQIRWKSPAILNVLTSTCARQGVPFADLTAYISRRAREVQYPLYYEGRDTHPNPKGYEIIAEGVSNLLESTGVL